MGLKRTQKTGVRVVVALMAVGWISHASALLQESSGSPYSVESQKAVTFELSPPSRLQNAPTMLDRVVNFESEKLSRQRERFVEAEQALQKNQLTKYRRLLPELADYPLYPYLRVQDIQRRLGSVSNKELQQFFDSFESQPATEMLRGKLLRYYIRKGQWKQFLAFYTPQNNSSLQCYHAYALIRTGNTDAAWSVIEKLWQTGKSRPRNCDRVFNLWKSAGKLTPELAWKRLELTLEDGNRRLASYLVRSLPASDRKLARTWIKLYRQPERIDHYWPRLASSSHVMATEILHNVMLRLARKNPEQLAELLDQEGIFDNMPAQAKYDLVEALAISLSRKHLPGAESWFAQIPEEQLTELGREWRIRVALRETRWQTALNAMNGLSRYEQESDRWSYWRARALEELGLKTTAQTQLSKLAQRRSYYGFLAADRMGLPYAIKDRPYQPTASNLFSVVQRPDVRRTREFLQLGRIIEARREWNQTTSSMTNDERINASKLAQLWGWADQSILTMARTDNRDDIDLRFPLLYQDKVMAHSQQASIDPAWTYGVIRRESAFVQDARSSKGAVGLMQLMPATAKRMSRSIKKLNYRSSTQLTHADTNLALGTQYLNKMLERFGGQTVLATAAYNAGENRVDRWLPKDSEMDAERWIENIPFRETREYVASVLAFTVIYADRLGLDGQRLSERMTTITPKDSIAARKSQNSEQLASLNSESTELR